MGAELVMSTRSRALAAILVAAMFSSTVNAQALTGFNGGTLFATFQTDGDTVGWRFSVDRPVIVTHLGFWDGDFATLPMLNSHDVALWDSSGLLLASNTVQASSPLTGQFRYEPVSNLVIGPGTYNLGAFYPGPNTNADGYLTGTTGITMAAGFMMLNTLRDPDGPQSGLVFPSVATAPGGRFGPNLLFVEVPEPSVLSVLGILALMCVRRRSR